MVELVYILTAIKRTKKEDLNKQPIAIDCMFIAVRKFYGNWNEQTHTLWETLICTLGCESSTAEEHKD